MKNREFWIAIGQCNRVIFESKGHAFKHGWPSDEVFKFREVLPNEKTYEDGIRAAIEALRTDEAHDNDCGGVTPPAAWAAWLSKHFNLSPADQKGEKNEE